MSQNVNFQNNKNSLLNSKLGRLNLSKINYIEISKEKEELDQAYLKSQSIKNDLAQINQKAMMLVQG